MTTALGLFQMKEVASYITCVARIFICCTIWLEKTIRGRGLKGDFNVKRRRERLTKTVTLVQVDLLRFKLHSLVAWLRVDIFMGRKVRKSLRRAFTLYLVWSYYRPPIESNITNIIAEQRALLKMYV